MSSLCLPILAAFLSVADAAMVDRNVAIVNDDTITLSEINELAKPYFDQVRAMASPDELAEGMARARRMVLEQLIDKRLITQEGKRRGIKVSDEELDETLQQMLRRRGISRDDYLKELREMGFTEKKYREEMRDQILSSKVVNAVLRPKVLIPEERILERWRERAAADTGDYNLLQLGVLWGAKNVRGETLTKAQAGKKIEDLRRLATEGADFAELARAHSDLPSAGEGGALGHFYLKDMAASIRAAVENLEVGSVSAAVEQDSAFVLFKRIASSERSATGQTDEGPGAAERDRIRQELMQQEMDAHIDEWIRELRDKAYIKIL